MSKKEEIKKLKAEVNQLYDQNTMLQARLSKRMMGVK